jgi:hypothetical protein
MTASDKTTKQPTKQPAKKATGTKGVFSTLPLETFQALKEKFPHCSTNKAVLLIIENHLGMESAPRASTAYRKYKCIHPATDTVLPLLNRSQVARVLDMKRSTLVKHMNKAEEGGYTFTANGWAVKVLKSSCTP